MNYYYIINGEQQGPVSEADLKVVFENDPSSASIMIWREGLPEWTLASTIFPIPSPPLIAGASPAMAVCCECGQSFLVNDMVTLQGQALCAKCQPLAVQKIKEGVPMGAAMVKGGTWRDGKLVLTSDGACLPGRCVKCNVATEDRVKRKLFWHPPAVYLVIFVGLLFYVVVALIVRKKATIEVGFCETHRKRRMMDILFGWIGFLGGIVVMVGGFANETPLIGGAGIILMVAGIIYLFVRTSIVAPKRIDKEGRVWLTGVCREYLDSLPSSNG